MGLLEEEAPVVPRCPQHSGTPEAVHDILCISRLLVWYGDTAVKGTSKPDLAGYCHRLYWVYPLLEKHTQALHIGALEFLVTLDNLIMFGSLLPAPTAGSQFAVLLYSQTP